MTPFPRRLVLATCLFALDVWAENAAFRTLQPGVEYGTVTLAEHPEAGDGKLHVIRIDPALAEVELGLASEQNGMRTAAQWAARGQYSVVINAGMFEMDYRSNVGHLEQRGHVNQKNWKSSYQSVLLLHPKEKGVPAATMIDRDSADFEAQTKKYSTVVQNLRLVRGPGKNVWKPNKRKWSEAFAALDDKGRLLFAFTRTPFEMADLMDLVLRSSLGVVRAMHVEGGPEASLSVRSKDVNFDFAGSYETGFWPRDDNHQQWELPNVIGVKRVAGAAP